MIRILIADDHQLIREGFKKILDREAGLEVVGEASNATEVLQILRNKECDINVLDISMPGKSGLDLLKELTDNHHNLKVLILSMHPEERFAVRALKAGASGYITKEMAPDILVEAIRKIHSGGKYVSPVLAQKLAFDLLGHGEKRPHEKLSDREFQVMRFIAAGKTINEIADELNLSQSTVNTYRQRVLEKMEMNSNAELIHYCIKNDLID